MLTSTESDNKDYALRGLPIPDQLLMLLIYYRLYLTQEFLTLLFKHQHQNRISRNIQQMRDLFEEVLPTHAKALDKVLRLATQEEQRRQKRISSIEEFKEAYPELSFIIDGVEQEKRKPKNKEQRKSDCSKKKSRHTRKQIVISTPSGIIVSQSQSGGGRAHDFKAFKEDSTVQDVCRHFGEHKVSLYADSGFQGIESLNLPLESRLIHRASRNHPLSREQKLLNRLRSSTRIRVEHTFSRRKKYAIASQVYRNADAEGLPEINTRVRTDAALQRAFGRNSCAEQSVVQETLDACTSENVCQMKRAFKALLQIGCS